ncbi:IST1-like protein [Linum grandiflorum]
MLDGLLGRGFATKCKSLIKQNKSRIDVIRRKRSATLKFLKKDVADLLTNGLEINAYGRAEGLVAELILSSCYDFVECCCDLVLKHLSVLQKMRHCPEDCREAVSSIMFAAARFSDLPELRDLRQLFLERYGDSLELYVNQGFVNNMSVKPASTEKKIQLLQDVASEFSIRWDSRGFEQRMSRPTPVQDKPRTYHSSLANGSNSSLTGVKDSVAQGVKRDLPSTERQEEKNVWKQDELNPRSRNESLNYVNKLQNGGEKEPTLRNNKYALSSPPIRQEVHVVKKPEPIKDNTHLKTAGSGASSQRKQHASKVHDDKSSKPYKADLVDDGIHGKPEPSPNYFGQRSSGNSKDPLGGNLYVASKYPAEKSTQEAEEDEAHKLRSFYNSAIPHDDKPRKPYKTDFVDDTVHGKQSNGNGKDPLAGNIYVGSKYPAEKSTQVAQGEPQKPRSFCNSAIPPPYTRPNTKLKDSKSVVNVGSANTVPDGDATDILGAQGTNHGYRSENNDKKSHHPDRAAPGASGVARGDDEHVFDTKVYYQGDTTTTTVNPIPKPRSSRRRHHKSQPSHDNASNVESAGVVKKKTRSRRKDDSRQGLQILFDDEQQKSDEEERIIDKLLVHYSKKPSAYEPEPGKIARKKSSHHHSPHNKSPSQIGRDVDDGETSASVHSHPSRSFSLPNEQPSSIKPPQQNKVFTRAASFEPARHVHPKLPDYDDLAARFAALKGS